MSGSNHYIVNGVKNTPVDILSEIIVDSILSEQFIDKDKLRGKIKSILKGFKVNAGSVKYSKILNPTDTQKLIRRSERLEFELRFWKDKTRIFLGEGKVSILYDQLENELTKNGF